MKFYLKYPSIIIFIILMTVSSSIDYYQYSYWKTETPEQTAWMGILSGDEPHYLSVTSSVYRYHSIYLDDFFLAEERDPELTFPKKFYEARNSNDWHVWGKSPAVPFHGLGISFLLIPGYVLGGILGSMLEMSAIFGLLGVVIFKTCLIFNSKKSSFVTVIIFSLCTMLLTFSGRLYPGEIVGLLLLSSVYFFYKNNSLRNIAIIGAMLGFMVFLKVTFLVFPMILLPLMTFILLKKKQYRQILLLLGLFILIFSSFITYNLVTVPDTGFLLGPIQHFIPQLAPLDASYSEKLNRFLTGISLNSFSLDNGLFVYSPLVLLSLFGIALFWQKDKMMTILLAVPFFGFLLIHSYVQWDGSGFGSPSRYMIPIIPISAVFFCFLLEKYYRNVVFIASVFVFSIIGLAFNVRWIYVINAHLTHIVREKELTDTFNGIAEILPSRFPSDVSIAFLDRTPHLFWVLFSFIIIIFATYFILHFKTNRIQKINGTSI